MEQEKNNTFSWVLRFATQCKGKMAASVLLAVLGSVCGIVPYFAVSQIVIQICGQNYDLIPIGFWALAALLGYLGAPGWNGFYHTQPSLGFYDFKEYPDGINSEALPCAHGLYSGYTFR